MRFYVPEISDLVTSISPGFFISTKSGWISRADKRPGLGPESVWLRTGSLSWEKVNTLSADYLRGWRGVGWL